MEAEGVSRLAGLEELAVMGGSEVVRRLPFLLRLRRRIERLFGAGSVDLFLPVDYPELNLRLARSARRSGCRVLYFIAPQVWAWRETRARKLAKYCDRVLTVLPFEAELLEEYGVRVEFVGHPLLEEHRREAAVERSANGLGASGNTIGLFPGSRAQEVRLMLPVFVEAARLAGQRRPGLDFRVGRPAHLPASLYADSPFPVATPEAITGEARAAITKSGTITLELAIAGVPMVVGYRATRLEWAVGRRLVNVPSIVLVNLVAGKRVVPELLQDALTPEAVVDALDPLLDRASPARLDMTRSLAEVTGQLGTPGCARRVAAHAADLLS